MAGQAEATEGGFSFLIGLRPGEPTPREGDPPASPEREQWRAGGDQEKKLSPSGKPHPANSGTDDFHLPSSPGK